MKLVFYFKSGLTVEVDKVKEWQVSGSNGKISSLSFVQERDAKNRIIGKSINLDSIDCIVEHDN